MCSNTKSEAVNNHTSLLSHCPFPVSGAGPCGGGEREGNKKTT